MRATSIAGLALAAQVQQLGKPLIGDGADVVPNQESVVQGEQFFLLRQFVAGPDYRHQGRLDAVRAVVKLPFVQEHEQRVENRAVGLENLVEEGDGSGGQVAVGLSLVLVFFKRLDRERAEEFFGHRGAGEQAFKVGLAREREPETPGQFALGRARRSDEQNVLPRERGEKGKADRDVPLDQSFRQGIAQTLETRLYR